SLEELSAQQGIGKSTAERIKQVISTGSFPELDQLIAKTPAGILEMLKIKGLGPKKIQIIWNDLEIESVGELYYACNENRLVDAKGFGLNTQDNINKAIEFLFGNQVWFHYAKVLPSAQHTFEAMLQNIFPFQHEYTGEFRRK